MVRWNRRVHHSNGIYDSTLYENGEMRWIFLRFEIANSEIRKAEFRYSEIAFFVLDNLYISMGDIGQVLAASAVRSNLYPYSHRNYDSVCRKMDVKSDFRFTGQLMEKYPEYSLNRAKCLHLSFGCKHNLWVT